MVEDFFPSIHPIPLSRSPALTWRRVASERADAIECLADTRRKNRNQFLLTPGHYCFFYESKRRRHAVLEEEEEKKERLGITEAAVRHTGEKPYEKAAVGVEE